MQKGGMVKVKKRNIALLIIGILVLLISSMNVFGIVDNNPATFGSQITSNLACVGMAITYNGTVNVTIDSISRASGDTSTRWYIYAGYQNSKTASTPDNCLHPTNGMSGTLIAQGGYDGDVGNVSAVNNSIIMTPGSNWSIVGDSNGSTRTFKYGTPAPPQTGSSGNIIWRHSISTATNDTTYSRTFKTITFSNYTVNQTITADYNFINQTPSDITQTNLFTTNNLTIFYNVTKPNPTNIYLNYSTITTNGWIEKVNGSVVVSGYRQTNYSSKVGNTTGFSLFADNGVYPSVSIGYNQSIYSSQTHNSTLIVSPNDYFKTAIYNISTISQNNYLELMLNSTVGTCRVFYCNSTYTTGNPATSGNCFHFATLTNTPGFNHSHGSLSAHNLFNFPINASGFISTVKVTSDGFFLINAQTGTCQMQSIPNTTRTTTTQYSTNNGVAYSNIALTMDAHLHQFNSSDYFTYQLVIANATNTTFSTFRTDNLEPVQFPPIIEIDIPDNESLEVGSRFLNITWSYLLTGATNINFSVYLLDQNDSVIKNLSLGQGNLTSYNWDITASQIPIGLYKIKVFGNDTNGLNSFDVGETFNITKNAYFNISAKSNITGSSVNNISGWFYNQNRSTNETFNTTTGTATLNVIRGDTYSIHVEPTGLAFGDQNFTMNYTGNYTFTLYTINSIDIKIYIEGTSTLLNQSTTLYFVSSVYSTNRTTSNGTLYVDLLTPSEYSVIVSSTGYAQKNYYFTLINGSYNQIIIYMSNTSEYTDVTANIIDEIGNGVDGAILKVLRYDVTTNSFKLVEMIRSNSAGQTVIHLKLATVLYQFIIEYQGVVKYTSSANGEYIYSTTLNFPIITGTISGDLFYDTNNIATDLYFDNATNTFTCTYTDGSNLLQTGCLEVREISFRPKYPMQSFCTNSPSGSLFISVINTTGTTYSATCYGLIDNTTVYFKSLNYGFEKQNPTSKAGLFIIVLIMMAFAFIGMWNLSVAAILFPLPMIFGSFMKIVPASVGLGAFGLELLMIIIVIVVSDKV